MSDSVQRPDGGFTQVASQAQASQEQLTMFQLLNTITLDNILLSNIGLGHALYRLACAVQRTGVRFDGNGNPTQKEVNKGIGDVLHAFIGQVAPTCDRAAVTIGLDPARPCFQEGEAYSSPVNSEVVMLLPYGTKAPLFPQTDNDNVPSNAASA